MLKPNIKDNKTETTVVTTGPGKAHKRSPETENNLPPSVGEEEDDPFSLDFTTPTAQAALVAEPVADEKAPSAPVIAVVPTAEKPSTLALELVPLDIPATATEPEPPVEAVAAVVADVAVAAPTAPIAPAVTEVPLLNEIVLLHAEGKTGDAAVKLEALLRSGKLAGATEQGWGMMFDLLQILGRRKAFENLGVAYVQRFEKSAPAWLEADSGESCALETGGQAFVALSGTLSAASAPALQKLMSIAQSNPTVRLGLNKVTDADNDGCKLLLDTLRHFKRNGGECLMSGAEEFTALLSSKIEMMRREREETWLLLLELLQQAGKQEPFDDQAVAYAVTFEVSPPSWETPGTLKKAQPGNTKATTAPVTNALRLEGELLAGMNTINTLTAAALALVTQGRGAITIEADALSRIDRTSADALFNALRPLHDNGLQILVHGANLLVAGLLEIAGFTRIATIETRRR